MTPKLAERTRPCTQFSRLVTLCALVLALAWTVVPEVSAQSAATQPRSGSGSTPAEASPAHDPLADSAFTHFYNMEYDRSIAEFEKFLDRHPNDPSAVNHLLSVVLMRELYRMGAMNTGEYSNDSFIGQAHRPADPKVKERIKQLVDRAQDLEEQELKANPKNVDALYARGVTRAQFALYTALGGTGLVLCPAQRRRRSKRPRARA